MFGYLEKSESGIGERNEGNVGNTGNQGGNVGNMGNQGGNEKKKGENLCIVVELMKYNCGEGQETRNCVFLVIV